MSSRRPRQRIARAGAPLRLVPSTDPPDADRLTAIRERLDMSTPGPWFRGVGPLARAVLAGESPRDAMHIAVTPLENGDAEFIAHAPEDVTWLLEQLEAARSALKDQVAHATDFALALHDYQRRMDYLEAQLYEAPDGVNDMLGLPSGWNDLDVAVDHAINQEAH